MHTSTLVFDDSYTKDATEPTKDAKELHFIPRLRLDMHDLRTPQRVAFRVVSIDRTNPPP